MATYVEIRQDNRVYTKFQSTSAPQGNPAVVTYVDVTNVAPQPEPGWIYDPTSGSFSQSTFPIPSTDTDQAAAKALLTKGSATWLPADLADALKLALKKAFGL